MDQEDPGVLVIRLSELLGKEVVTESGWSLGHVFDVRVALGSEPPRVMGLVVGAPGVVRRLYGEARRRDVRTLAEGAIPWEAVEAIEDKRIRVREVASPEEEQRSAR
jgi:sporulation protein YlmC with PRC-barrel domain